MRILVDSADLRAIRDALATGVVTGVTTNPTLLRRADVRASAVAALAREAIASGAAEVHLQAYATDADGMVREGREFASIDPARIHVKLVATAPGYRAAAQLASEGIAVTLTAVYTLRQAVAAESAGARAVAVYLSRLHDSGVDPMELVGRIQAMLTAQAARVEILAASIRDPDEVGLLGALGVASATLAPAIVDRLIESDATAAAAAAFTADARTLIEPLNETGRPFAAVQHSERSIP